MRGASLFGETVPPAKRAKRTLNRMLWKNRGGRDEFSLGEGIRKVSEEVMCELGFEGCVEVC